MNFSAVKDTAAVFHVARYENNRKAAIEIELRALTLAVVLSTERGWDISDQEKGLLRSAARLALSRYLDHRLWETCRSCEALTVKARAACLVCAGAGSWFMPLDDFVLQVGSRYTSTWMERINEISKVIETWCNGGDA